MKRIASLLLIGLITIVGCKEESISIVECEKITSDASYFHNSLKKLTDVIVHDIFSPPVASRVYLYPCIAAYEVIASKDDNYISLAGQIKELEKIPMPKDTALVSYNLASSLAFIEVGQALIFSEDKIIDYKNELLSKMDSMGISRKVIRASHDYAIQVKEHILEWAGKDNYNETRSYPKFALSDDPSRWKPTPPSYLEGIEPHWREIRTMVIDSAQQFVPPPPPEYSLKKGADFYNLVMEVYNVVRDQTKEQKTIASFWDCNPFVMNQTGHIMYATKKITPGGHWMGITSIASKKSNADLAESIHNATWVAIGLFDGFISCWDEKYRSSLTRPETVINEHIDPDWIPTLQTPPFPEHTSGHSVISTASAVILTHLLGDKFSFTDDVEVEYGLGTRSFSSFREASEEAAISRLYGGIHYMPAIKDGVIQGEKVGNYIIEKIRTKK